MPATNALGIGSQAAAKEGLENIRIREWPMDGDGMIMRTGGELDFLYLA